MTITKRLLSLITLLVASARAQGQPVEMADAMRSEGKIYVVVAIVLLVLVGLILYLFLMERKLRSLERKLDQKTGSKSQT